MASTFKNTIVDDTSAIIIAQGNHDQKPLLTKTLVSFTSGSGSWTVPIGVTEIEILLVGGGGGAGANNGGASYNDGGGGGGAGGLVYLPNYAVTPGDVISYSIGAGGTAGNASRGGQGGDTTFGLLTALGGGGGGMGGGNQNGGTSAGLSGGSGGGSVNYTNAQAGGSATQPGSSTGGFGNAGSPAGGSASQQAGGGGGAGGPAGPAGYAPTSDLRFSGAGGPGLPFDITGTMSYYAGGGGGGRAINGLQGAGGIGGGGSGGTLGQPGTAGTANTGGGGGGAGSAQSATAVLGAAGGSGVIHIRYISNVASANANGILRYSSTTNAVEVYQNNDWVIQDPTINYAGHNMFTYSQNYSTGWALQSITLTSSNNTAPDGTATAALLTVGSGYTPLWRSGISTLAGVAHTMSGYFKAGSTDIVNLTLGNGGLTNCINVRFNLTTQTITGAEGGGAFVRGSSTYIGSSITSAGNGWYRCSITGIVDTSTTEIRTDYWFNNSTTIYVWGLHLERATFVGPYTRTDAVATPVPEIFNNYQIHKFTTSGTTYWVPAQSGLVEVLVVAGGGGGGYGWYGGGGGAGGLIYNKQYKVDAGKTYTVTVGSGGAGSTSSTSRAANGGNSQFGSLIAIGGGGGGSRNNDAAGNPSNGGSGGSGGGGSFPPAIGGAGVIGQGNNGGGSVTAGGTYSGYGMGGGGASGPGGSAGYNGRYGNQGGGGLGYDISGVLTYYAGGGGGGANTTPQAHERAGGIGGGGNGGVLNDIAPTAGTANTGGGGGGSGGNATNGAAGGSGIIIVRYLNNTTIAGTLDGSSPQRAAASASAIKALTGTTTNGFYWIHLPVVGPTLVYCDMNTAGGGWMHCATFADNNEAYSNSNVHPWGAPLYFTQYTGIWQDNSVLGSQSFTADYKNNVWNYFPMTQQLMKDSGASLRNLWYTGDGQITRQTLSTFWANRQWLALGSDSSPSAVTNGRVHFQSITTFGVNDPVFGSSGLDKILFKYGEADGVQDGNKDRAMISYVTGNTSDVDSPKGIGCHTSFGGSYGDFRYRDIVPTAQNTGDFPPNSITGTHALTLWVR